MILGCYTLLFSFIIIPSINCQPVVLETTEFTPNQYHIQTDSGDRRFFKYQTWSGQFRKESRLDDGSVVGNYGWVDANGVLRMYYYIADDEGYRITNSREFDVTENAIDGSFFNSHRL